MTSYGAAALSVTLGGLAFALIGAITGQPGLGAGALVGAAPWLFFWWREGRRDEAE